MYTVHVIDLVTGNEWFRTYSDTAAVITYVNEVRAIHGTTVAIEVL